ncbi:MAG: Lrp/AsnC ligand binding domain-containing protein [Candidatus Saganbacteria bacterium]|nr:Lrp/AsnC ligand binding domain-containing protein [Candidatus Saganbacteria bacterium]
MTQAYILIECHPGKGQELSKAIAHLPVIKQVHFVTGPYDVIAFVEVPDLKQLGDVLIKNIQSTGYVSRTLTCITVDQ